MPRDDADVRYWPGESSGEFSVSTAYARLRGVDPELNDVVWRKVWRLQVPERIRSFIWQIMHGKLATKEYCSRWNSGNVLCHNCNTSESFSHVLRDCTLASQLWNQLIPTAVQATFYGVEIFDWLDINISNRSRVGQSLVWCDVWAIGCYYLWLWRNKHEHVEHFIRPPKPEQQVLQLAQEYQQGRVAFQKVSVKHRQFLNVAWQPPMQGCVAINTDGAWKEDSGVAGCGGVVRDSNGRWLGGYSKRLHVVSSYLAELWGVLEGISLAASLGYGVVEVQIDSQIVVDTLNRNAVANVMGRSLVARIRSLLGRFSSTRVIHVFREANKVADGLANLGCTLGEDLLSFTSPPPCVESIVINDVIGVSTPRLILV